MKFILLNSLVHFNLFGNNTVVDYYFEMHCKL